MISILLIIIVLLKLSFSQLCSSTCQQSACSPVDAAVCIACDPGLMLYLGQCTSIASQTQIIIIINSSSSTSSYISLVNNGANTYDSTNFSNMFDTTGMVSIPQSSTNILAFYFQNIPINYQLQLRVSGSVDKTVCLWNYIQVKWGSIGSSYFNLSFCLFHFCQ